MQGMGISSRTWRDDVSGGERIEEVLKNARVLRVNTFRASRFGLMR